MASLGIGGFTSWWIHTPPLLPASGIQVFPVLQYVEVEQQILVANANHLKGLGQLVGMQFFPMNFTRSRKQIAGTCYERCLRELDFTPSQSHPKDRSKQHPKHCFHSQSAAAGHKAIRIRELHQRKKHLLGEMCCPFGRWDFMLNGDCVY